MSEAAGHVGDQSFCAGGDVMGCLYTWRVSPEHQEILELLFGKAPDGTLQGTSRIEILPREKGCPGSRDVKGTLVWREDA